MKRSGVKVHGNFKFAQPQNAQDRSSISKKALESAEKGKLSVETRVASVKRSRIAAIDGISDVRMKRSAEEL